MATQFTLERQGKSVGNLTTKNPKGTVVVAVRRSLLYLRLPRQLFNGEKKSIFLGLPDTPINRKAAEAKAKLIESDIAFERFDFTLARYKSPTLPQSNLSDSPPISELWEKYTTYKSKFLSKTTLTKDFKKTKNHILNLPSLKLEDAKLIRSYLAKTLTYDAAKRCLQQIRACCDWAVYEEIIPENPFSDLRIRRDGSKPPKTIDPFTNSEKNLIIAGFEDRHPHYTLFVKFLFLTGCRTGEAIGLQWQHISPDLSVITFSEAVVLGIRKDTKTHSSRRFPINARLKNLLLEIKPPQFSSNDPVFVSEKGCLIDSHNFLNRAWKPMLTELKIRYRPQYNTRHTFITLCMEAGIPIPQIADWVGNSGETIMKFYAGINIKLSVPEFDEDF